MTPPPSLQGLCDASHGPDRTLFSDHLYAPPPLQGLCDASHGPDRALFSDHLYDAPPPPFRDCVTRAMAPTAPCSPTTCTRAS